MIKKILIIDDSSVSRKILKKCIGNDKGYEFHEAENGEVGLAKYKEITPDLVFLDLTMPVMDGRVFLQMMKDVDPEAVIIVCTADVQKKAIEEVEALGAVSIVSKPPNNESVFRAVLKAGSVLRARNK